MGHRLARLHDTLRAENGLLSDAAVYLYIVAWYSDNVLHRDTHVVGGSCSGEAAPQSQQRVQLDGWYASQARPDHGGVRVTFHMLFKEGTGPRTHVLDKHGAMWTRITEPAAYASQSA